MIDPAGPTRLSDGQTVPLLPERQRPALRLRGYVAREEIDCFAIFMPTILELNPKRERSREIHKMAAFFSPATYQTYSTPS